MTTPMLPLLLLALPLVGACATVGHHAAPLEPPSEAELDALPIFDGHTGERATWDDLHSAIDNADLVVLGELHGHPVGLPFDAKLFRESLERHPNAALCLEFLTRDAQYILDAYAAGLIDWDKLEAAMEGIPASSPAPHKPLIDAAISAGVPVVAANAPRLYTRAARAKGFDALAELNAEQRRLFDIPTVLPSGPYRDGFYAMMSGGHAETEGEEASDEPLEVTQAVKDKFRAQALWDGTMSASMVRTFEAGRAPVFLVIGSYHCNNDGGTVQQLAERKPDARRLVISFVDESSDELREDDSDLADFVVYVGPYPE